MDVKTSSVTTISMRENSLDLHEEEDTLIANQQKTWFDFYVHPNQLDEHIEELKLGATNDSNSTAVKPTALELIDDLLHQVDKTYEQEQLQQQQMTGTTTSTGTPGSPTQQSHLTTQLELSSRLKRLWYLVDRIVDKCNFSLTQIEALPISNQKKLLLSLIDYAKEHCPSEQIKYKIMFHHWILRSILNTEIDETHILNPKHELLDENLDSTIIDHIGLDSVEYLKTVLLDKQETSFDELESMLANMAQFYFRVEKFAMAKQMFQRALSSNQTTASTSTTSMSIDEKLVKSMINACDCILLSEDVTNSNQYHLLKNIERVVRDIEKIGSSSSQGPDAHELIQYLVQDNATNALSLGYREELLVTHSVLRNTQMDLHFKISGCNIIKKLIQIITNDGATFDGEQSRRIRWKNYIMTLKYLSRQFATNMVGPYALIYAIDTLKYITDETVRSKMVSFLIDMLILINDIFMWATFIFGCSELRRMVTEEDMNKYEEAFKRCLRSQFIDVETFFDEYSQADHDTIYMPIPREVFTRLKSNMEELKNDIRDSLPKLAESAQNIKKRRYASLAEDQHYLISKQRRLSEDSELYVPYLLHCARQRLFNSSTINTLSYNHAAHMLHDVLSELKQQETHQHSVKFDRSYEYDVILLNLAHKEPPEQNVHHIGQHPHSGDKSPRNIEEYEKLMSLLQVGGFQNQNMSNNNLDEVSQSAILPPLTFLVGLLRFLVNLDDWIFIRDYFGTLSKLVQGNEKRSPLSIFCNFACLLQELYAFSFSDQSSDSFLDDIRDMTFDLIYNLRTKMGPDSVIGNSRKQKNCFYSVVETQNMRFKMQMVSIFSFTLSCLRRSSAKDTPIHGHYFDLAECNFTGDVRNPTHGHILAAWRGKERHIDDMISDMLKYTLEQLIDRHSDELCKLSNCHFYYFTLGDICFERKQFIHSLSHYLQVSQELFDRSISAQQIFTIYTPSALQPMVHSLNLLGEYTAAAALHQFMPIASAQPPRADTLSLMDQQQQQSQQPKIIGYDKRMINDLSTFNELDKKWLMYFWDLSYVELLIYIEHNKAESENEKLLMQHLQRSEMNMNNSSVLRKQFVEQLQIGLLQKLYLHIATKKDY